MDAKKEISVILILNLQEAARLQDILQNPITEQETPNDKSFRQNLFKLLDTGE